MSISASYVRIPLDSRDGGVASVWIVVAVVLEEKTTPTGHNLFFFRRPAGQQSLTLDKVSVGPYFGGPAACFNEKLVQWQPNMLCGIRANITVLKNGYWADIEPQRMSNHTNPTTESAWCCEMNAHSPLCIRMEAKAPWSCKLLFARSTAPMQQRCQPTRQRASASHPLLPAMWLRAVL